jgi:benzylsuccinate CoA-transferase BbsE subunit
MLSRKKLGDMEVVTMKKEGTANGLLEPYRILDLSDDKAFLCGKILGDLGADVIKIERPGGDEARNISPFYDDIPDPEKSLYWFTYNTSKRGITLDIKTDQGQDIFKRLVNSADCVIESFPLRYLDNLGLGWSELSRINPRLIMTSVTPFGQTGPYKDYKICDLTAQALSGLMYTTGYRNGTCLQFANAETRQAYLQAGLHAAVGTMLALHQRVMTGIGQQVDVSIAESMVTGTDGIEFVLEWELGKRLTTRDGDKIERGGITYSNIFACKDGYVSSRVFVGGQGHLFEALVKWMDSVGMAEDLKDVEWTKVDREELTQERVNHWEEVLSRFFLTRSKKEVQEEAAKRGIVAFPVNEPKDLLDDPQLVAREFFVKVKHPELGSDLIYPGAPYKSTLLPPRIKCRAPLIGEHNDEIYQEIGVSKEELLELKESGVI